MPAVFRNRKPTDFPFREEKGNRYTDRSRGFLPVLWPERHLAGSSSEIFRSAIQDDSSRNSFHRGFFKTPSFMLFILLNRGHKSVGFFEKCFFLKKEKTLIHTVFAVFSKNALVQNRFHIILKLVLKKPPSSMTNLYAVQTNSEGIARQKVWFVSQAYNAA